MIVQDPIENLTLTTEAVAAVLGVPFLIKWDISQGKLYTGAIVISTVILPHNTVNCYLFKCRDRLSLHKRSQKTLVTLNWMKR